MKRKLARELLSLQQRDSDMRSRLLKQGKLHGEYHPEMRRVHVENARRLDAIIAQHGWPGLALAGVDGGRAAWLIAQHANCTPWLQRKFLAALAAAGGEAPGKHLAFLTDRIRFNEGKPQVYGTVLDWNEYGELSCEVEDPAGLDARRRSAGLVPFAVDLVRHRREVEAEGGLPPEDFDDYRRRQRAWARSVGWR